MTNQISDQVLAFMVPGRVYQTDEVVRGVGRTPQYPHILKVLRKLEEKGLVQQVGEKGANERGYSGWCWRHVSDVVANVEVAPHNNDEIGGRLGEVAAIALEPHRDASTPPPGQDSDSTGSILVDDVTTVLNDQSISATERASLVIARVGQGPFRNGVLKRWDYRCSVTGSTTLEAIRASHIKPWRESTNEERLDPNNGLPLLASFDALFDVGLISFESSGTLIVSPDLNSSEQQILGLSGRRLRKMPSAATSEYLAYHRKSVFRT